MKTLDNNIIDALVDDLGATELLNQRSVSGGCINQAVVVETDKGPFFIKVPSLSPLFSPLPRLT